MAESLHQSQKKCQLIHESPSTEAGCAVTVTAAILLERKRIPGSFPSHPSSPLTWALKADFHPLFSLCDRAAKSNWPQRHSLVKSLDV